MAAIWSMMVTLAINASVSRTNAGPHTNTSHAGQIPRVWIHVSAFPPAERLWNLHPSTKLLAITPKAKLNYYTHLSESY